MRLDPVFCIRRLPICLVSPWVSQVLVGGEKVSTPYPLNFLYTNLRTM